MGDQGRGGRGGHGRPYFSLVVLAHDEKARATLRRVRVRYVEPARCRRGLVAAIVMEPKCIGDLPENLTNPLRR